MLEHGGGLRQAARKYNIPLAHWLDLSTGINPNGWPVKDVPGDVWTRLPEEDDGLNEAACTYYGGRHVLPVAGSQAAIQALPQLRNEASQVAVLSPAYSEHAQAWQDTGFDVMPFGSNEAEEAVEHNDVVVLVNPCNPTGACFDRTKCLIWHKKLASRGGWLVVDEAFMDVTSGQSLVRHTGRDGLIVLRSVGKFFGLAGARTGFVFGPPALLNAMNDELGPWTISGPSRYIAQKALEDFDWQRTTRQNLRRQGQRLAELLSRHELKPDGATSLFCWVQTTKAAKIHEQLAGQAILTRLLADPASLRFGLPGSQQQWQRLEQALQVLQAEAPS